MRHKVLIIAQDRELYEEVRESLQNSSLDVTCASTFLEAVRMISRYTFTMVMMDFGFSEQSGVEMIRRLRQLEQMPILVLSAHATRSEEIETIKAGADHYLAIGKPLDTERCLAYAMAVMRRHLCVTEQHYASILISGSGLKINLNLRKAYLGGEDLNLTPKQFSLLNALVESMGRVVTKEDLYQITWKENYDVNSDEALKYHIRELRKKLRIHGADGLIETAWGVGYQFHIDNPD